MLYNHPKSRTLFPVSLALLSALLTAVLPVYAEGTNDFFMAVERGNSVEVRRLLETGISVETKQQTNGWTPLIAAARAGKTDIANLLLDRGANPNMATETGYTPLMAATQSGNLAIMRILLLRGADPNKATPKGLTALMIAASKKGDVKSDSSDLECVKLLLRGGADPDKKYQSGATAFSIAEARSALQIVTFLRRVGAANTGTGAAPTLGDGIITGVLIYRERIAVSSATFGIVRLLDISAKSPVVLTQTAVSFSGKQVPINFSLSYKKVDFTKHPNARLALDARLISGGVAQFLTPKSVPVLTQETSGKNVTLLLVTASPDKKVALLTESINATDLAIEKEGVSIRGSSTLASVTTNFVASFLGGQLTRIVANSAQNDYGTRNDRFYFGNGTDTTGYPPIRAAFLKARRVARTLPTIGSSESHLIPGEFEDVVQKVIFNEDGSPALTDKYVNKNKMLVDSMDIQAAKNFAHFLAVATARQINAKKKR